MGASFMDHGARELRGVAGNPYSFAAACFIAAAALYILSLGPVLGFYSSQPTLWDTWHCRAAITAYSPVDWACQKNLYLAKVVTKYRVGWYRYFMGSPRISPATGLPVSPPTKKAP